MRSAMCPVVTCESKTVSSRRSAPACAQVLGLADHTGSLTPGKQADITVIDLRSPHLDGFGDPVAMLGLGAGPADVETVLVSGEFVKRDGTLIGAHATKARDLMHETQARLRATTR